MEIAINESDSAAYWISGKNRCLVCYVTASSIRWDFSGLASLQFSMHSLQNLAYVLALFFRCTLHFIILSASFSIMP